MANKFRWFTHDHDAHEDGWIRNLVRKQGHVAGWMWWVLVEIHHKHGVGDVLRRDFSDVARAALTSTSVLTRVLTEMATEFEGEVKVRWKRVGSELELEIPKLRKRQAKLKSKIPSKLRQDSVNVPSTLPKKEKEKEIYTEGFDRFWETYPRKKAKPRARGVWDKIKPTKELVEKIIDSVKNHIQSTDWQNEGGKYIPYPVNFLKDECWEDEPARVAKDPDIYD